MSARGPRGEGSTARADIVAAARTLFTAAAYDRVSMRAIARQAGVDPALVRHYFASKGDLFVEAMRPIAADDAILRRLIDSPRERLGEALVDTFLLLWDDPVRGLQLRSILANSMSAPEVMQSIRTILMADVLLRITGEPFGRDSPRASAAASQMIGLAFGRYVVGLPALVDASRDELVALFAPTFQRYLAGPIDGLPGDLRAP